MSFTSLLFLFGFFFACLGAFYAPIIGIMGYILHYHMWPEKQWWGASLEGLGLRYSLMLAMCVVLGTVFNRRKLSYGPKFMSRHEWLLVLFGILLWISVPVAVFGGCPLDNALFTSFKISKVLIFALILTHVATTIKRVDLVLWALVAGAAYLGYQAYTANPYMFTGQGRLDGIGGPDFREANGLGGHLAAVTPLIAVQFLRKGWKGKLLCLCAGALAVNALALTRSRGAFIGLAGGAVVALLTAPKGYRKIVLAGMVFFCLGVFMLTDQGFWSRVETIRTDQGQERDFAVESRLEVWDGAMAMLKEHPLGVGAGNFPSMIGKYVPQHKGRDAHNTYVLCCAELGLQGLVVFMTIFLSAWLILKRVRRRCRELPPLYSKDSLWIAYGIGVSICVFMFNGLTTSRIYNEAPWWLLAMPLCMVRSLDNLEKELPKAKPVPIWKKGARRPKRATAVRTHAA